MSSTPVLDGDHLYLQLIHGDGDAKTKEALVVCLDKATGEQCDEYPLRATLESEAMSVSLRKINGAHNAREGVVYGAMAKSCGHEASYKSLPPISQPFIVVPMPHDYAPPSFFLCDSRRLS